MADQTAAMMTNDTVMVMKSEYDALVYLAELSRRYALFALESPERFKEWAAFCRQKGW